MDGDTRTLTDKSVSPTGQRPSHGNGAETNIFKSDWNVASRRQRDCAMGIRLARRSSRYMTLLPEASAATRHSRPDLAQVRRNVFAPDRRRRCA